MVTRFLVFFLLCRHLIALVDYLQVMTPAFIQMHCYMALQNWALVGHDMAFYGRGGMMIATIWFAGQCKWQKTLTCEAA